MNLIRTVAGLVAVLPVALMAQTLTPMQDAYYVPGNASNFGNAPTLTLGATTGTGLVQFDLTQLPAGTTASQIAKATLTLFVDRVITGGSVNVYVANGAWTETTVSGANAPAPSTVVASNVPVSLTGTYVTLDATAAVADWVAGNVANNGFLIQANNSTGAQLDSKENTSTSHPATLTITLSGPQGPAGPQGATGAQGPAGATGATGAPGTAGPQGPGGATGSAGANGNTVLNGTTAPIAGIGNDGDFYVLNPLTAPCIYGPKAGGAWPGVCTNLVGPQGATGAAGSIGATGAAGPQGPSGTNGATGSQGPQGSTGATGATGAAGSAGTNGNTVLSGTAVPAAGVGNNGDFYIRNPTTTPCIYGPKAGGAWPGTCTNLVGPQGSQGATGATGAQGATGSTGAQGAQGPQGTAGQNANGGGFWSVAHTPLASTVTLSLSTASLGTLPDTGSTLTLFHNACNLSLTAYSTVGVTAGTMVVRSSTSPTGTFSNTALSCSGSANSFLTCSGQPLAVAANSFLDLSWNNGGTANGAAPSGVYAYASCN